MNVMGISGTPRKKGNSEILGFNILKVSEYMEDFIKTWGEFKDIKYYWNLFEE